MTPGSPDGNQAALPAGTGNAPGFGETFSIDLNTGQSAFKVPVALPPGVAGFSPKISLNYSSAYGHGVFGFGWRLPCREISRQLDFGIPPAGGSSPGFIERFMDSGDEIVPLEAGRFGRIIESAFDRYERQGDGWIITERNGNRLELGLTAQGRIPNPDRPADIYSWLLERSTDSLGNEIRYGYLVDRGTAYLAEIGYAIYTVRISYEPRPDVRTNFRAGFHRATALRGKTIELFVTPPDGKQSLVRTWTITYSQAQLSDLSLLDSFSLTSHSDAGDLSRNPIRFTYQGFAGGQFQVRRMAAGRFGAPPPLTERDVQLTTLDNAPLPGVLMVRDGAQFYWPNAGNFSWGEPRAIRQVPHVNSLADQGVILTDVDGNGAPDLLVTAGAGNLHGYYAAEGGRTWSGFVAFPPGVTAEPPWSSGRVALADLDGDGRIDALYSAGGSAAAFLNQGNLGWSAPQIHSWGGDDVDLSDPLVRFADMTGDGLSDLVRIRSGSIQVRPNLGFGKFGPPLFLQNAPELHGATFNPNGVHLLDINGDGLADLAQVTATEVVVYMNLGGRALSSPIRIPIPSGPVPGTVRVADMNGVGRAGLVWNSIRGPETVYVALSGDPVSFPYALTAVDHGTGLLSSMSYRSAVIDLIEDRKQGVEWDTFLPFAPVVVAEVTDRDMVSGRESRTSYRYRNGHFEPRTRRFEGFGRVSRVEQGDESRADTLTVFEYRLREELKAGNGPQHSALNRMLFRVGIFSQDGSAQATLPLKIEGSEHTAQILATLPDGRLRVLIGVVSTREEMRDRTDDLHVSEHVFEYDQFANVTKDTWTVSGSKGGIDVPAHTITTEVTYANDAAGRILDRFARVLRRDQDGAILTEVRRFYDGPAFEGLPFGTVTHGLVTRIEQLVFTEADFAVLFAGMGDQGYVAATNADGVACRFAPTERCDYDAAGVLLRCLDGMGRLTTYQYVANGLFEQLRNTGAGDVVSTYDMRIGQPLRIDYPDGSFVALKYDAQGRLLSLEFPGDASPSRSFVYDDQNVPHSMQTLLSPDAASTLRSVTYYDGYGKMFQTRKGRAAGRVVVSGLSRYNGTGLVKQEFEPQIAAGFDFEVPDVNGKPSRDTQYDALGRVIRAVNYNGGISTASYAPFAVALFDANDNDSTPANIARGQFDTPRTEEIDVYHRRERITEATGGVPSATTFSYAPIGTLESWSDATGQVAQYAYDLAGRRTLIQLREAGERRLWRDASMKLIRTLDGSGNDVRFEYDAAGRLATVSRNGLEIERYTYTNIGINGQWKLAAAKFEGGSRSYQYSLRGDLVKKTLSIDGDPNGEVAITYDYDGIGRETRATFPGNTIVTRDYYDDGLLRSVAGFITGIDYDARGLPVALRFANSVTTTYSYTAGVGRVLTQRTAGPGNAVLEDLTYSYDLQERLLSRQDTAGAGSTLRLSYDPLYQLTKAEDSTLPQAVTYGYKNDRYMEQNGESAFVLLYGDAARPGRITAIQHGADPLFNLQYDGNGNMAALPQRTMAFNHRAELVSLTGANGLSVRYLYDQRGDRVFRNVARNGTTTTTVYVDPTLEVRDGEPVVCVVMGRTRVAARRGGKTHFLHTDVAGTARFVTDELGAIAATILAQPFGTTTSANTDDALLQYALHPIDAESGLVYMGRRYYAPEVASFVSPDPLALFAPEQPTNIPAGLLVYAYAANDPLNRYDPTGTGFWEIAGAVVGAAVGLGLGAALVAGGVGLTATVGVATVGLVAVGYIVANSSEAKGGWEEFARGFLIGLNAGLNYTIGSKVYGDVVGTALGVINIAAAIEPVAQNKIYQGILGWSNWLMPMSWLVNGLGVGIFVLDDLFHLFTLKISVDWETGTLLLINRGSQSFDMGNVAFLGGEEDIGHETGHNLSLAAFGSAFHFIGAISEGTADTNNAQSVYAEQLADSHKYPSGNNIPQWGE